MAYISSFTESHAADEAQVRALYQQFLDGWNNRDADVMSAAFAQTGEMIGFDGSQLQGRTEMTSHLRQIFADHPTPSYIAKVRQIRFLGPEVANLRAAAGMVPPGQSDIHPGLNAHHTMIAVKLEGEWRIALFQNTPAQFHGRPDLVEQFTEELKSML